MRALRITEAIGVANISIFTAIWAGVMFVAVTLARRNGKLAEPFFIRVG